LHVDDGFGACEAAGEAQIVALECCHFSGQRVDRCRLAPALLRCQRAKCSGSALTLPVGQGRGIKALAAQNGGDVAGLGRAIGLGQDAQFVLQVV